MTNKLSLEQISDQISESVYNFYWNETTAKPNEITMDDVLEQACSTLPSDRLRFLVPKIVLSMSIIKPIYSNTSISLIITNWIPGWDTIDWLLR